jgi:glycosyltransferase involved in cell wall biosynthesis
LTFRGLGIYHPLLRSIRDGQACGFQERFRVKVLIAIPVYNERKYVRRVLSQVLGYNRDVLVVDDGSTDGTGEFLAEQQDIRLIRHPRNMGYGQSLIDAFAYADEHGFDWVITMDCDEQHEPARIPDFLQAIRTDRWDLISGSRYLQPSKDDDLPPGDRRSINATITAMVNEKLGLNLTDSFCGFKAHRISAMRRLNLTETGYAFPLQLWPQVARAGLRVTEIPVRLIYNDPKRSFGGVLDDAAHRLQHYLSVFRAEMEKSPVTQEDTSVTDDESKREPVGCSCCW